MLEKEIRLHITAAVQKKDDIEKNILRLALGEIQRVTSIKDITEQEKEKIIKKLIKSNTSTLELTSKDEDIIILKKEIEVLETLLPKEMTKEDILAFIKINKFQLTDNLGKSIGIVMKAFKKDNIIVNGKVVKEIVTHLMAVS